MKNGVSTSLVPLPRYAAQGMASICHCSVDKEDSRNLNSLKLSHYLHFYKHTDIHDTS